VASRSGAFPLIYYDFDTAVGRLEVGFNPPESCLLSSNKIYLSSRSGLLSSPYITALSPVQIFLNSPGLGTPPFLTLRSSLFFFFIRLSFVIKL